MAHYIVTFVKDLPEFSKGICLELDRLIHQVDPDLQEGKKWEFCGYWTDKGIVFGLYTAKAFVTFNFYEGALLKDDKKLFNYGDMNARGRSIKFTDVSEIKKNEKDILAYIKEAVENNKKGLKAKASDRTIETPADLKKALTAAGLTEKFERQTYTMRKEYIVWVESAKKEETRQRRIGKAVEMIKTSKSLK